METEMFIDGYYDQYPKMHFFILLSKNNFTCNGILLCYFDNMIVKYMYKY